MFLTYLDTFLYLRDFTILLARNVAYLDFVKRSNYRRHVSNRDHHAEEHARGELLKYDDVRADVEVGILVTDAGG